MHVRRKRTRKALVSNTALSVSEVQAISSYKEVEAEIIEEMLSRAGIGVQAVRRYGSGHIGYRAMYVRIGNPVVCSIDRT
jgi:hypothetical protein